MMIESVQTPEDSKKTNRLTKPTSSPFKTIVKNNLTFWLRRLDWSNNPQIEELSLEKENIIKAIHAGLRIRSTHSLACHLLYVSSDTMLQIGSRRPWWLLTQKALDLCPAEATHVHHRLTLCQAKHLLLDENYDELKALLAFYLQQDDVQEDVDALWEAYYLKGVADCRLNNFSAAQDAIQEVSHLLQSVTLLQPHLCKGKISMLGGEVAIAQQDWEKANYCLNTSLHHLSKINANYSLASTLELIGRLYEKQEDIEQALKVWEQAVELIPESFSFEMRSRLQANIARLYLQQGKLSESQLILEQLDYGMMRLLGCHHLHLESSLLLIEVLRMQGETEQAQLMRESVNDLRDELSLRQN